VVLAALPELEFFRGVSIFRDPESTIGANDERASHILNPYPLMQQVDLGPLHAIALVREATGSCGRGF